MNRSAFPFKKELAIATAIWLTYAIPTGILYLHPKGQSANVCWVIIGAVTAILALPVLIRILATLPEPAEQVDIQSPE